MAPKGFTKVCPIVEAGEICDVACQYVNYEIDYILLITDNGRMKLCRQMVHDKRQFKK